MPASARTERRRGLSGVGPGSARAGARQAPWPIARDAMPALLLAACAGASATGPADDATSLSILTPPVVTISGAEEMTISVEARDVDGSPVAIDPASLRWTTSVPEVAEVVRTEGATATLRAAAAYGFTRVYVRGPGTLRDSVGAWVQPPETAPSTFTISLVFSQSVSTAWREELTAAARRWEEVIRLELPAVPLDTDASHCRDLYPTDDAPLETARQQERGVVVHVATSFEVFAGQEEVDAAGTVCAQRPMPRPTAVYGLITLNRATDLASLDPTLRRFLAVHEMGHALGLVGSFLGISPAWFDGDRQRYFGVLGLEGYRRALGGRREDMPVQGLHWAFAGDIMSAVGFTPAITELSIGALMDSGYPAAWYGAGDLF